MTDLLRLDQVETDEGQRGKTGAQGKQGVKGDQGPKGDQGVKGDQGQRGQLGETGSTGKIGPQGKSGSQGDKGNTGLVGASGNDGGDGVSIDTMEIQGLNLVAFFTDGTKQVVGRVVGEDGRPGQRGLQGKSGAGLKVLGAPTVDRGLPFFFIRQNKTVIIPENRQSLISGERIVEGDLIVLGEAVEI